MKTVYVVVYHYGPICSEGCWASSVKEIFFNDDDAVKWINERGPDKDGYYDIEEHQIH